ncbi:nucleotidyltransferase-like protein [Cohnella terricola]|uniref:Uncharacterized protein n=1 Tax=Cohnella terricola TaxID=1289167 RepID=A0A559J6D4_9BACL|nr:nucleotidyltransferase-like protein [Cohnella terricola]TVX95444.1 hypothetical protein FPZ45_23230 [Cohnella terricola]
MIRTEATATYLEQFGQEEGLISLLHMENPFSYQPVIDGLDRLVLIVTEAEASKKGIEHRVWNDIRIQVRRVTPEQLESWIVSSSNRGSAYWLIQGDIIVDRDDYLATLRGRLMEWSPLIREQKLLSEFSRFVRSALQAKQDLKDGKVLDAYSNVLSSLHYWAHIVLVEEGMHPELTVWEQMRRVNPGIYKLFEELTTSGETLEQRVELVLLACEFAILNKMESSCALLIRLIESRKEAWSPFELQRHPDLSGLPLELSVLLYKLVNRGHIREVAQTARLAPNGLMELEYTSAKS